MELGISGKRDNKKKYSLNFCCNTETVGFAVILFSNLWHLFPSNDSGEFDDTATSPSPAIRVLIHGKLLRK